MGKHGANSCPLPAFPLSVSSVPLPGLILRLPGLACQEQPVHQVFSDALNKGRGFFARWLFCGLSSHPPCLSPYRASHGGFGLSRGSGSLRHLHISPLALVLQGERDVL